MESCNWIIENRKEWYELLLYSPGILCLVGGENWSCFPVLILGRKVVLKHCKKGCTVYICALLLLRVSVCARKYVSVVFLAFYKVTGKWFLEIPRF